MGNCLDYIVIPDLPNDECQGERIKTSCVYSPVSYTLLDVPANSSLDIILNAFVVALNAQNTRLNAQDLLIADLESRIETLEAV